MYIGEGRCQAPSKEHAWHNTSIHFIAPSTFRASEATFPSYAAKEEWLLLMPHQPSSEPILKRLGFLRKGEETRQVERWDESFGVENAEALTRRLQLAGWMEARVYPSWKKHRRGVELELIVEPGVRWTLDTVVWNTHGSGLSDRIVREVAGIQPGQPFEHTRLQDAQDAIANYAKSIGLFTFHSGYVSFEVDTLDSRKTKRVSVKGRCRPYDLSSASWVGLVNDSLGKAMHPKVRIGEIRWNSAIAGENDRPGGVRREVWEHIVRLEPGQEFKPSNLSASYSGLSALPGIQKVSLAEVLRWDTSNTNSPSIPGRKGTAFMDVDFVVFPKPSHDLGFELDVIRNNTRYGPRMEATLLHRNPRGWGAENAWEVGFGYVAVDPFSSVNREVLLNSGEWNVDWGTTQLGIWPFPLTKFRPSASPFTSVDLGWRREVWPEFTRTQFHAQHAAGFVENPERKSTFQFSPMDISFVNLGNRDSAFVAWLEGQNNPLILARFNNHMTLSSGAAWESGWSSSDWRGRHQIQLSWSGMLAQALAERVGEPLSFDPGSGAWLIAPNVPVVQHQRLLVSLSARNGGEESVRSHWAWNMLFGWANAGQNTPSLPLEQAFVTGGANGVRGWRLRTLGPGNVSALDTALAVRGIGDVRFEVQLERRIPLVDAWNLALFSDAGNVWLHGEEAYGAGKFQWGDLSSFAWSCGLGMRYDLEFFLLRLDGALRMHDPTAAEGERWIGTSGVKGAVHLGLGLPF